MSKSPCNISSWTVTFVHRLTGEKSTCVVYAATEKGARRKAEEDADRYGWSVTSVIPTKFDFPNE